LWALQQREIANLVLVGSSQTAGAAGRASLVPPKKAASGHSSYQSLIAGIQSYNVRCREIQEQFAYHARQMSQIPLVRNRWRDDRLEVYGLFYRVESGLFLVYDLETDTFKPLCS